MQGRCYQLKTPYSEGTKHVIFEPLDYILPSTGITHFSTWHSNPRIGCLAACCLNWRIYADFAQSLIHTARRLYVDEDFGLELDTTVYALDSTTIDLCLSVFPWAQFRKTKAVVKLHTLLDLRSVGIEHRY